MFGPDLRVVVARELTKLHEEFVRGPVAAVKKELASRDRIRGEITLLVQAPAERAGSGDANARAEKVSDRVARLQSELKIGHHAAFRMAEGEAASDIS